MKIYKDIAKIKQSRF